jgi:hypothetical protein
MIKNATQLEIPHKDSFARHEVIAIARKARQAGSVSTAQTFKIEIEWRDKMISEMRKDLAAAESKLGIARRLLKLGNSLI